MTSLLAAQLFGYESEEGQESIPEAKPGQLAPDEIIGENKTETKSETTGKTKPKKPKTKVEAQEITPKAKPEIAIETQEVETGTKKEINRKRKTPQDIFGIEDRKVPKIRRTVPRPTKVLTDKCKLGVFKLGFVITPMVKKLNKDDICDECLEKM